MSTYLVIANRYDLDSDLSRALERVVAEDRYADFVLLTPATPADPFERDAAGRARDLVRRQAGATATELRRAGFAVKWSVVSDESPVVALNTEVRDHPGLYAGAIVATPAQDRSRWRDFYLLRATEALALPLVHVVEDSSETAGLAEAAV